jgi:nitronate monooxygenase
MSFKGLQPILYGGKEVWPLVEGGKGVAVTNHASSGAWAKAGGIGTVSAVNADFYDGNGEIFDQVYQGKTRFERHNELVEFGITGGTEQVRRAYDISGGQGAININILWEMGGAQRVLEGVLERTRGLVTGVTCGAGMPYKLAEIAARFNVHYLPIISSARAFRALWKRAYHKFADLMGAVVYEDPWLAGGHNGLSNAEDPLKPEDPYPRVKALRDTMRAEGIADSVPIVMAGGVWYLRDWENWIDNPELGQIIFQFGTRPLLTQESPIPQDWKDHLRTLEDGDVLLHRFSPTGFYSSRPARAARSLIRRSRRASTPCGSTSGSRARASGSRPQTSSAPGAGPRKALSWRSRRRTIRWCSSRPKNAARSTTTRPSAWVASRTAGFRRGKTMTIIPPATWLTHAVSASRRRCRTSLTAKTFTTT